MENESAPQGPISVGSWNEHTASDLPAVPADLQPVGREYDSVFADSPTGKSGTAPRKRPRWGLAGILTVIVAALLAGVLFLLSGLLQFRTEQLEADAPAPTSEVSVPVGTPVRGPDGRTPISVTDDNGQQIMMSVDRMAASRLFIPALGVYSTLIGADGFEQSRYRDFDTLAIPDDPMKTGWYSKGGALAEGAAGTTFLAGHVAHNNRWGALRSLHKIEGGEVVYTSDANGIVSAWQVNRLWTKVHTEFPQDMWASDGERRLVVTTCAERDPERPGYYRKNIFVQALPFGWAAAPSVQPAESPSPSPQPVKTEKPEPVPEVTVTTTATVTATATTTATVTANPKPRVTSDPADDLPSPIEGTGYDAGADQ